MKDFEKIEKEFYAAKYGSRFRIKKRRNPEEMWKEIKDNQEILRWAIKLTKDKFGERDLVNGLCICDSILIDYNNVDKEVYQDLINLVFSNKQIARIVQDGYCNGGYSYLLMALWNPNLKLTEDQKTFAVNEAMNKIGTTRYYQNKIEFSKKLDQQIITDFFTTTMDIDEFINPIGLKSKAEYTKLLFDYTSDTQAHGRGAFDIRYWILKNPNWSTQDKQQLIMDFWYSADDYEESLNQWELSIGNEYYNDNMQMEILLLYDYSYEQLLRFFNDAAVATEIWNEIQFCKLMRQLRPPQWLKFSELKRKLTKED